MGIATQNPELRARLQQEEGARRVANYLKVSMEELKMFARITGHDDIHALTIDDLCTVNRDMADYAGIPHA